MKVSSVTSCTQCCSLKPLEWLYLSPLWLLPPFHLSYLCCRFWNFPVQFAALEMLCHAFPYFTLEYISFLTHHIKNTGHMCHVPLTHLSHLIPILEGHVLFFFFFKNVYLLLWDRESDRAWVWEGQREEETHNPKRTSGSELSTQSLTWGSNPQTARSWPELKSDA